MGLDNARWAWIEVLITLAHEKMFVAPEGHCVLFSMEGKVVELEH